MIHNGTTIASVGSVGYGTTETVSGADLVVAANDYIDFVAWGDKTTQIDCSITLTTVPEPTTTTLLTAGLLGLLAYAWRKRS